MNKEEKKDKGKNENKDEKDEEKNSIKKRDSTKLRDDNTKEIERKIRERKNISLIKQGFNLK